MSMYFNNTNSVSTLFSSLSTSGASNLSSVLSDYNSLRNGSYKKLLSSYYEKFGTSEKKSSSGYSIDNKNENTREYSYTSYLTSRDSASTLSKIKSSSNDLVNSTSAILKQGDNSVFKLKDIKAEDGTVTKGYDRDAIAGAVNSFVDNYNSTVKAASASGVSTIRNSYSSLLSATSANSGLLSQIGITVNEKDNTLSVDADRLKSADVSTIKSLFNGAGSYASSVQSTVSRMNQLATYEADKLNGTVTTKSTKTSTYSSSTYNTSEDSGSTISKIKSSSGSLYDNISAIVQKGTKSLFNLKDIKAEDGSVTKGYDKDSIYDALSSFVNNYNNTVKNAASSSVSSIKRTYENMVSSTSANSKLLDKIGISINSKDNTLSIDKDKFNSADMSTVKSLFNDAGSYAYSMATSVSQMNAYAAYEASRANTYTNSATYSNLLSTGSIYDSLF